MCFLFIAFLRVPERKVGKVYIMPGSFFFWQRAGVVIFLHSVIQPSLLSSLSLALFFPYCTESTLIISFPIMPLPSQRYHHRSLIHSIVRPSFAFHLISFPNKSQYFSPPFSTPQNCI